MVHQKILIAMVGLLIALAGGVFVLLSQGNPPAGGEIAKKALVASVQESLSQENSQGGAQEESEVFEVKLQTEELGPEPSPVPKLAPSPTPQNPAPAPTLLPEADAQAETPAPQPSPVPVPTTTPETPSPSPSSPAPQPQPQPQPAPSPQPAGKININTAGLEELDHITGVGPAIAQRIIGYRTNVSLFYVIEDIKNVSGIGDVTFEKMKDEITVGDIGPAPIPQSSPPPPAPSPAPQPSGHTFYTSSYHSSKLYYCDTDSVWESLSATYLESYPSEEAVLAVYPEKTLHEPCE
ncbi:MAG TPA: helix-hairpin-helix domain-containing protein [Candidatus Paceibacterota bacterium]|nr:helix-hairpin-helix domain-containing protein [Candidatus Paceibacterota bacterium]